MCSESECIVLICGLDEYPVSLLYFTVRSCADLFENVLNIICSGATPESIIDLIFITDVVVLPAPAQALILVTVSLIKGWSITFCWCGSKFIKLILFFV